MTGERTPNRFPVAIDIKIYITDGKSHGIATYSAPIFKAVSDEEIQKAIDSTTINLPDGYRLMDRKEAWNFALTREAVIKGYAIPVAKEGEIWLEDAPTSLTHEAGATDA